MNVLSSTAQFDVEHIIILFRNKKKAKRALDQLAARPRLSKNASNVFDNKTCRDGKGEIRGKEQEIKRDRKGGRARARDKGMYAFIKLVCPRVNLLRPCQMPRWAKGNDNLQRVSTTRYVLPVLSLQKDERMFSFSSDGSNNITKIM